MLRRASSKIRFFLPEDVPSVWLDAEPQIIKALNRGSNYSIEQVYEGLINGEMQLWAWDQFKAVMVTSIQESKGIRFCLFLALGGEKLSEWIQFLPIIEDWARKNDCQEMRIYGRIGWAKHTGYKVEYTKMSKTLRD